MNLESLLANLNNPQPAVRIDLTRVLGMLDETQALQAVGDRYKVESDSTVRGILAWTGKRLYAAQQQGYTTLNAIFQHFNIDREIAAQEDKAEAALIQKFQNDFSNDMQRQQQNAAANRAAGAAALGAAGALLGGASMGAGMAMGAMMTPGAEAASSNLGNQRPETGISRIPAVAPSTMDIQIWVKRLREADDTALRQRAAQELGTLNNPAALPFLGSAFMSDPDPAVQAAVQRAGKLLYWNARYWRMTQDGTLQAEIDRRSAALHGAPTPAEPDPPAKPAAQNEDIGAILRAARAGRQRRQQKR